MVAPAGWQQMPARWRVARLRCGHRAGLVELRVQGAGRRVGGLREVRLKVLSESRGRIGGDRDALLPGGFRREAGVQAGATGDLVKVLAKVCCESRAELVDGRLRRGPAESGIQRRRPHIVEVLAKVWRKTLRAQVAALHFLRSRLHFETAIQARRLRLLEVLSEVHRKVRVQLVDRRLRRRSELQAASRQVLRHEHRGVLGPLLQDGRHRLREARLQVVLLQVLGGGIRLCLRRRGDIRRRRRLRRLCVADLRVEMQPEIAQRELDLVVRGRKRRVDA
mmetsp:Transcript_60063/g.173154  ORF Transcript_60063/g.173154 Transcript_60063/m.173154 type:complete len:279 (+) Transcript_60063:814-1650(+)